jgi:hypothetical protein
MPVLVLMRASTVTWCSLWFSTFTCRQGEGMEHRRYTHWQQHYGTSC